MLYVRSRQVPAALVAAVGSVAALWSLTQATDDAQLHATLGLMAVVAATAAAGTGLTGADVDLDRTAAIAWPPRRAVHLVVACAVVIAIVAATALTGDELAILGRATRDAIGMIGLLGLGAAALGASHAWIPLLTWTLLASTVLRELWPHPDAAYETALMWMLQPPGTATATVTALILGLAGALAYAFLGPRGGRSTR